MDSQIANAPNNSQLGDDIKTDGTSYANALLSHKQLFTVKNKENIMDNTTEPQAQRNTPVYSKQIDSDISKIMGDDDGTFTPVISNSRKDRKVEKHRKQKNIHNGVTDKNDFHEKTDKKDSLSSKDKQKEVKKNQNVRDNSPGRESSEVPTDVKKVFVEAPLPKTNPWQVKNTVPININEPQPGIEKKVLQPQKQVSVNGTNPGGSSTNVKDKKLANQKVRLYLYTYFCLFHKKLSVIFLLSTYI